MMLVLTRHSDCSLGSAVYLDYPGVGRVTVRVLSAQGHKVRLGIEAPASVHVLRDDAGSGPGSHPFATAPAPLRRDD